MSVERQHGQTTLICDGCDEELGQAHDEFADTINCAKAEGWLIKPDGEGGWEHKCSSCKSEPSGLAAQKKLFGR